MKITYLLLICNILVLGGCSAEKEPEIVIKWKPVECLPKKIIVGVPEDMTARVTPVFNACGFNDEIASSKKACRDALERCNLQLDEIRLLAPKDGK